MRAAIFNILSERIARNLRRDFYESIINKDVAFFDDRRTGDLISRLNADVQTIQDSLGSTISMFLRAIFFILCVLIIMLVISPELTGMTFAGVIPLVIVTKLQISMMRTLQRKISTYKGKMNNVAEESFSNVRTVKAFANEQAEVKRFMESNVVVLQAGRKNAIIKAVFAFFTQFMLYSAMAAVVYIASILYQDGKITIGQLSSYLFYMTMLNWNFMMVSWTIGTLANIMGSSDKIVEIVDYVPAIDS